jgi:hypothetical protein
LQVEWVETSFLFVRYRLPDLQAREIVQLARFQQLKLHQQIREADLRRLAPQFEGWKSTQVDFAIWQRRFKSL